MPNSALDNARAHWADWRGWPYVLVGLAVLLRLAHIWNSRANPTFWAPAVDPGWYDQAAQNILMGNWGQFPFFRAPAYPALLAAVYAVFGRDLMAARVLNAALQGAAVWAVWRVGRAYVAPAAGVIAALLLAVNGTAIYFAGEILSTSAEMLAAILGLWATLRLTRDHGLPAVMVCGLAWGVAALVRPNFLFVFPVALAAVYFSTRAISGRRALTAGAVWLASAFAPILPVTAVNYVESGELVLIASQGGVNFWIGNNPESTGILSVLPGYGNTWTLEDAKAEAERELGRPAGPGELSRFYYAKGWSFLSRHPGLAVRFMIRKTALYFNRFEISNNKHIGYFSAVSPWLPPLQVLNFGVLVPLGLLGFWVARRQAWARITAGLIALYALSVALFFVTSRFRMPSVPCFSLLAAGGLWWMVETLRSRPSLHVLRPLLLLVGGAAIAYMNPWHLAEAPVGWARYMEGNAYLKLNDLDSARVCFEDAIRDSQAVARSQINLGVIALRQGDTTGALVWYEAARSRDPFNPDVWNNLGAVYEWRGDTLRAIEAYHRALALQPWAPDPRHNLAGAYFRLGVRALKQGQDSLAVQHLGACLNLEPSAAAHYNLAVAYGRLGATSQALSQLERALTYDPRLGAALQLRERLLRGTATAPEGGAAPPAKHQE
ncbi:MAG: tetratricopeptide repeat protein [bacterium]|nr:tetratricopeptide repeat protein [bacterium]